MIDGMADDHCLECMELVWANLDFSVLSTATTEAEPHQQPNESPAKLGA